MKFNVCWDNGEAVGTIVMNDYHDAVNRAKHIVDLWYECSVAIYGKDDAWEEMMTECQVEVRKVADGKTETVWKLTDDYMNEIGWRD